MKALPPVLCSAIALPEGDAAPEWLHLLPAGAVRTIDGRGPYNLGDVQQLMAASIARGKLVLDENHSTDLAAPKGGSAPARGWIVELQQRDDGIWGKVDWVAGQDGAPAWKQYRGISPVIAHDKTGRITAVLRASLTNTPNLAGLTALHSQENEMDLRAMLIEALGLASDADDAAIVAAVKKDRGDDAVAMQAALAPIAQAAGLAADADAAAVLAGVQQLVAGAGDGAAITALQSELASTAGRLVTLTDTMARDKATAFVDGAIAGGRVGVKPLRDRYITMHMADPAGTAELIGAMPIVTGGATLVNVEAKGADGLGPEDVAVIQLMGLDRTAYAATQAETRQEAL